MLDTHTHNNQVMAYVYLSKHVVVMWGCVCFAVTTRVDCEIHNIAADMVKMHGCYSAHLERQHGHSEQAGVSYSPGHITALTRMQYFATCTWQHRTMGSSSPTPNQTLHLLVEDVHIPVGKRWQQLSRDIKQWLPQTGNGSYCQPTTTVTSVWWAPK